MFLMHLEMSVFEVANTVSGDPMNKIEKNCSCRPLETVDCKRWFV